MSIKEIESKLNDLEAFLNSYIEVFNRIEHYEMALRDGAVETPAAIEEAMDELVSLYSTLNTAVAFIESKFALEDAKSYIKNKDEIDAIGTKTTERYVNSKVELEINHISRICKLFSNCRNSCEKMVSVMQTKSKIAEREFKLAK